MSGAQNTSALEAVLAKVAARRHITVEKAFLAVGGPLPIAGPASWSNDWHAYRPCPYPHLHMGLDIFAAGGTPIVSTVHGWISEKVTDTSLSGNGLQITGPNNMQYFYAHLSAFAAGISIGTKVKPGQVIGFVGNTGNAAGGPTHVHMEIQPGGTPTPPKPFLDRWLLREISRARALLQLKPQTGSPFAWRVELLLSDWRTPVNGPGLASAPDAPIRPADRPTDAVVLEPAPQSVPVALLAGLAMALVIAVLLRLLGRRGSEPPMEPPRGPGRSIEDVDVDWDELERDAREDREPVGAGMGMWAATRLQLLLWMATAVPFVAVLLRRPPRAKPSFDDDSEH